LKASTSPKNQDIINTLTENNDVVINPDNNQENVNKNLIIKQEESKDNNNNNSGKDMESNNIVGDDYNKMTVNDLKK